MIWVRIRILASACFRGARVGFSGLHGLSAGRGFASVYIEEGQKDWQVRGGMLLNGPNLAGRGGAR